jgi:hypothetical protein
VDIPKSAVSPVAYMVTVTRLDTGARIEHLLCPSLDSALAVKSRLFKTHHAVDLTGADIPVPHTVDFDDWDEVDRLRRGSLVAFFPIHVALGRAVEAELSDLGKHKRSGVAVPAPRPAPVPAEPPAPKPVPAGVVEVGR